VIGAGPAGLTVAREFVLRGHRVTVLDAGPGGGGVLRYGIPRFKKDHGLTQNMTEWLAAAGVEFRFGRGVGRDPSVADLLDAGSESVFLGTGAGLRRDLDLMGSDLEGVHNATPYLVRANVEQTLLTVGLRAPVPWMAIHV